MMRTPLASAFQQAFAQFADHYYRIHQSIVQAAEQQRKAHDERQQSRRRDVNGSGDDNLDEGVPPENSAEESDETKTEIAAEELLDEDAAMGVKKWFLQGVRANRVPAKKHKPQKRAIARKVKIPPRR